MANPISRLQDDRRRLDHQFYLQFTTPSSSADEANVSRRQMQGRMAQSVQRANLRNLLRYCALSAAFGGHELSVLNDCVQIVAKTSARKGNPP